MSFFKFKLNLQVFILNMSHKSIKIWLDLFFCPKFRWYVSLTASHRHVKIQTHCRGDYVFGSPYMISVPSLLRCAFKLQFFAKERQWA